MSLHPNSIRLLFSSPPVLSTSDYGEAEQLLNHNLDESRRAVPQHTGAGADIRITREALPDIKLFGACWGGAIL